MPDAGTDVSGLRGAGPRVGDSRVVDRGRGGNGENLGCDAVRVSRRRGADGVPCADGGVFVHANHAPVESGPRWGDAAEFGLVLHGRLAVVVWEGERTGQFDDRSRQANVEFPV